MLNPGQLSLQSMCLVAELNAQQPITFLVTEAYITGMQKLRMNSEENLERVGWTLRQAN